MTKFTDGPAAGQTLMLHRAPVFLRAVQSQDGKWDALDQPLDKPARGETIWTYELVSRPGQCHIRASGGRGGFYPVAEYKLCAPQPSDATMRDNALWREWVDLEALNRNWDHLK